MGDLQQQVGHSRKLSCVSQLNEAILEEWKKLSQRFIDCSINEWRRHRIDIVQWQVGHIEHVKTV